MIRKSSNIILYNDSSRCLKMLLVVNLLLAAPLSASQLAQVALTDRSQLDRLYSSGLEVHNYSPGGLAEVILMDQGDRERLNQTGLTYFISLEDIEGFNRSRLAPGRDDMGGYPTFDEIVDEMNTLQEDYPEIVSEPYEIGRSIEDRPIYAFRFSDNPNEQEDEPEVLFTSLIHCREVITSRVLFGAIARLIEGYGNDAYLTSLVDERQIWFIPVVNPDGYVYNESYSPDGGGMWRKNRRRNQGGSFGVDLNRNFGHEWGYDDVGSSPTESNETYRGTEPFSEPETQSIRDFVNDHRFSFSIFFHSWGNLCLYPYGYDVLQPPDRSVYAALSKKMIGDGPHIFGTGWEAIYMTNGDSDDWLYDDDGHDPILAFTVEVGTRQDYFWPPLNRVEPLVAENFGPILTLVEYADAPKRILNPLSPHITHATITPRGWLSLRWDVGDDEFNPPVSYRITARLPGQPVVDEALANQQRWELKNISVSQAQFHRGGRSYRMALNTPMATMTLLEPMVAPDTISAWLYYNLRSFRSHCLALEISEDGYAWEPLPGNRTEDFVVNQHSIGPGITGISGDWLETWWETGDWAGKVIKMRFRYYSFNTYPNPLNSEFCYIDDISPFPVFDSEVLISEDVQELRWAGRIEAFGGEPVYSIEAVDSDGDVSFFSVPVPAEPGFESLVLRCEPGWSLISAPFEPLDPSPAAIFSPWIERESLVMLKDGWGNFFLPAMNFDQIRTWNPLRGYFVKLRQADTLAFPGEGILENTPISLGQGWSTISFLPASSMGAERALESIVDNLIFVKNGLGEFWAVQQQFNNLRAVEPGMGLLVKLRTGDTLVYPEPERFIDRFAANDALPLPGFSPSSPYNMSLLFDLPEGHEAGSIRLYDRNGKLSGGAVVPKELPRVGIAAWGGETEGASGYAEGDQLRIFWRSSNGVESPLRLRQIAGSDHFETDGFARFDALIETPTQPFEISLTSFPNPFNGRTDFYLSLSRQAEITLGVFDVSGRIVEEFDLGKQQPGVLSINWDANNLPDGLYLVKMTAIQGGSSRTALLKAVLAK